MEKYHLDFHINKHFHVSKFLRSKYNDLVIADTFRTVALSMISLFIPIFLFKIGFSFLEITYYELSLFTGALIFHYLALRFIPAWGVKRTLVASYLITILFYLVLSSSQIIIKNLNGFVFLVFVSVLNIIPTVLYWSAHHIYFLKSTKVKDEGQKLGILLAIPMILGIASPFLGSLLISNYGFKASFLVSAFLMLLASYALFFSSDIKIKSNLKWKKIINFSGMRKNIIFIIQGSNYFASGFAWPMLLFFSAISLIGMGVFYFISGLICAFASYWAGKQMDKKGSKKISDWGSAGHGFSLIFRALSTTAIYMTTFQALGGFFGGLMNVALDTNFFKNSHQNICDAIMNRELYMYLGRIISVFLLLILLYFFTIKISLVVILIIAGLSTFILNIITKNDLAVI